MMFDKPFDGEAAGLPVVKISLSALKRNWRFLAAQAPGLPPLAVVKADAYGHGIIKVAKALSEEGCTMFATGSIQEGAALRRALGAVDAEHAILPLLGPLSAKDANHCIEHNLIPLVHSAEAIPWLGTAYSGSRPLPVAVKIETGMSRLGYRKEDTGSVIETFRSWPNLEPTYLVSHLAAADDPKQAGSVAEQGRLFMEVFAAFRAYWPRIVPSLCNSAGFLAREIFLPDLPPHICRPGFALYGGNPFAGTTWEDKGSALEPVMEVLAPVMGVHSLSAGTTVSYGRTFTAPRDMKIAVIGSGYADGLSRTLSGKGRVSVKGAQCPVLGRVCMQMHIVDVSHVPDVQPGDEAYVLGGAIGMADIAKDWGTIPYEVFCVLGKNNRVYA